MAEEIGGQENSNQQIISAEEEYSSAFAEASRQKAGDEEQPEQMLEQVEEQDSSQEKEIQQGDEDDVPEEFKNTQHYKSMFGRIEKERLAKEALAERLKSIEASQRQLTQQQPQRPVFERQKFLKRSKRTLPSSRNNSQNTAT